MSEIIEADFVLQDCRFRVREGTNDRDVIRSIFEGEYALPDASEYVDGSTSLDIGAHLGAYSVWACATYPVLNVLAVEPLPENLKLFEANRKSNVLDKRMRAVQRAVGPAAEQYVKIGYGNPSTESGKIHQFVGNGIGISQGQAVVEVPIMTMTQIMAMAHKLFGCIKFWTVKIDCEGGEEGLLQEASDAELSRIKWLVGEYHENEAAVRGRIEAAGFLRREMEPNQNHTLFCYENQIPFKEIS